MLRWAVVVKWLAELALDQEVPGSIPAPFKLLSESTQFYNLVSVSKIKKDSRIKNTLSYVTVIGLMSIFGQKEIVKAQPFYSFPWN